MRTVHERHPDGLFRPSRTRLELRHPVGQVLR